MYHNKINIRFSTPDEEYKITHCTPNNSNKLQKTNNKTTYLYLNSSVYKLSLNDYTKNTLYKPAKD